MNVRLDFAISCAIALFLTATAVRTVDGQLPEQVTATVFFAAEVNGHTDLQDFHTYALDRDQLKVTMGQPSSESCEATKVETTCTIEWDGISVFYSNVAEDLGLVGLTLTNSAAFLEYGSSTVRVGDPIGRLESIFPQAYRSRGDNCPAPAGYPPCRHAALVHNDANGMMFRYDPSTRVIEEIRWFRNIL